MHRLGKVAASLYYKCSDVVWVSVKVRWSMTRIRNIRLWLDAKASEAPIVGVLAQEANLVAKSYPDAHSFMIASYVKFLESGGARVLPVWIGQDEAYYRRVVRSTNGMLFPGGGAYFNASGGYGEAARQIYRIAVEANEGGVHYPLLGICLGIQVLIYGAIGIDIRRECQATNISLPLDFAAGYENSKLLSNAPAHLLQNLQTKNLTNNNHHYCIFEIDLKLNSVQDEWRIISTNRDRYGLEFVSSIEHINYPFFGLQYHPEKVPFEFKKFQDVSHSSESIAISHYLSSFFIGECRTNNNSFTSSEMEDDVLIYNYNPVFSIKKTIYEQLYLFERSHYNKNLL